MRISYAFSPCIGEWKNIYCIHQYSLQHVELAYSVCLSWIGIFKVPYIHTWVREKRIRKFRYHLPQHHFKRLWNTFSLDPLRLNSPWLRLGGWYLCWLIVLYFYFHGFIYIVSYWELVSDYDIIKQIIRRWRLFWLHCCFPLKHHCRFSLVLLILQHTFFLWKYFML